MVKNKHITLQVSATGLSPLQTLTYKKNRSTKMINRNVRINTVRVSLDVELDIIRIQLSSQMCFVSLEKVLVDKKDKKLLMQKSNRRN